MPPFAKALGMRYSTNNARSEEVSGSPARKI
jgi:hypothetical protein